MKVFVLQKNRVNLDVNHHNAHEIQSTLINYIVVDYCMISYRLELDQRRKILDAKTISTTKSLVHIIS